MSFDVVVVGAGLSGAVFADRFARVLGKRVLVIDKRDHIAGNCYDYVNADGHLMNKYGLHIFHCNDDATYNYINQFSEWIRYDHKVVARVVVGGREEFVPVPVNIETVNKLCGENLQTPTEMDAWLAAHQVVPVGGVANGEEAAKARVGETLYKALFETYTKKQWGRSAAELDHSVLERIPVRRDHDVRYFSDKYQVIPAKGYTAFVAAMLDHPLINVRLGVDYFRMDAELAEATAARQWLIYTGPIDHYFSSMGYPALEYRSIDFREERLDGVCYYQRNVVVNEPGDDVGYTRTVEYKHLPYNSSVANVDAGANNVDAGVNSTTIVREYTTDSGEPYYPVPNAQNAALYERYKELADKESGVLFVGRLANYKYKNMNEAIADALALFNDEVLTPGLGPVRRL